MPPERILYVLIPPSPLFAAHWSLFIPDASSFDAASKPYQEPKIGRRIHVSGDRLNGFTLEIVRDYDVKMHRGARQYPIATIPSASLESSGSSSQGSAPHLQKDEDEGGGYVDNRALDEFERICVEVEAPGPSLNRVSGSVAGNGKRARVEVRDCQWWVRQVVLALEARGILATLSSDINDSGKTPADMVAALPVH